MKINIKNEDKINAAINAVEGNRVSVRQADCASVYESVKRIETRLAGLLLKKDWVGLIFFCDPNAQTFPNSYKGIPESTQYKLERTSSGWFVTNIYRGRCDNKGIREGNMESKSKEILEFVLNNF